MTKKEIVELDLSKYYPLGIPMLKLMIIITSLTFLATAAFEIIK